MPSQQDVVVKAMGDPKGWGSGAKKRGAAQRGYPDVAGEEGGGALETPFPPIFCTQPRSRAAGPGGASVGPCSAVLEMTPTAARAWAGLAHVYVRSRRFDDARQAGIQYLEIYPRDAPFAMWLGTLLIDASRPADAVAILEPLATRVPSRELHERLGFALALAGRRAEGIAHLRQAITLAPREWWPYWGLAHVYYWGGEFDQAIPLFEKALELRPHHPEARDILARVRTLAAARDRQLKSP